VKELKIGGKGIWVMGYFNCYGGREELSI